MTYGFRAVSVRTEKSLYRIDFVNYGVLVIPVLYVDSPQFYSR